jgi:hypothetical protein
VAAAVLSAGAAKAAKDVAAETPSQITSVSPIGHPCLVGKVGYATSVMHSRPKLTAVLALHNC